MTSEPVQYSIRGDRAATIVRSVERGVVSGALAAGEAVPSVRVLARELGVSPTTVAAAYRDLRQRGVLVTHDRSRTVVGHRPSLTSRLAPDLPPGTRDLTTGNPDPTLLPDLGPALAAVGPVHRLYGDEPGVEALLELARVSLEADGVATGHLAVVGGGLDGIERVLEVHLRLGDRIGLEDPGYAGSLDLARALGLTPVGIAVDDEGPLPDALEAALADGLDALVVVPRAANPSGAALSPARAEQLRPLLDAAPELLLIEDDHASAVAGVPAVTLSTGRERWAVVRSVAKALGPDLRVAVLAGDEESVQRVLGRQRLGTGWVSHLLQHLTAEVWRRADAAGTLATAAATYARRRDALRDALADAGIVAHGTSGLNLWVPVPEEVPVVQGLLARGWGVQAGEPYRIDAPPGVRITIATLTGDEAPSLADDLAEVLDHRLGTRRG
ncbi:aminotransferase class I/II-fold pyridoxal phosphate-dependent enzyme [Egicoccus halophilus]|uniref:GntR family transcriptional regulator n=1 Tax=Egicoccus halophilus TaxID=1670830 RepID=A0A8J3AH89_9ACTN|nr:aminotransferase class I/II-fold pyridoxal phosphate-dependent enzyme [Egicoccus halophilus]GGI09205.1 GntR family transcriptional regulator [Egicoccus halophilus]